MYEELFNKLQSRNALEESIQAICEGMTWEQIAKALYQILDDIDTADDMCKEDFGPFRNLVMGLQAKKNQYLHSLDGFTIEPVVDIDEARTKWKAGTRFTMGDDKFVVLDHDEEKKVIHAKNRSTGEVVEIPLVEGGLRKKLATAAATGLVGGAAMLGGFHKGKEQPAPIPSAVPAQVEVDMDKIASIESSNDPRAVNRRSGARGLTQIMKPTWEEMVQKMDKDWTWEDAFDSEKNKAVGSYYMNVEIPRLLRYYGIPDTVASRIAAYNWGIGNLKKIYQKHGESWEKHLPEETLDYLEKYGPIKEAVGTALSEPEEKMKEYYSDILDGPLEITSYSGAGEGGWRKFWLLTDGTIVPVDYTHGKTAKSAGTNERELGKTGAFSGYVQEEDGELGLRGEVDKFTSEQITALKSIYEDYQIYIVYSDVFDQVMARISSSRDLVHYLMYGKSRSSREWESIEEDVATTLSEPEEILKDYFIAYPEAKLEKSTWGGPETNWRKFWLLTDGTIIPVEHSHADTAWDAGVELTSSLYREGALAGYVDEEAGSMGFRGYELVEFSPAQIMAVKRLYDKYPVGMVFADMHEDPSSPVSSSKDLIRYLRTGRPVKAWESIKESLVDFARKELELAGMFDKDSDYEGMLGKAVMDLIEEFASQGHSGCSAMSTVALFDELARYKPLSELTDNPDEWMDLSDSYAGPLKEIEHMRWQSRRCPSCFSSDGGRTYYDLDEMTVEHEGGKVIHKSKPWREE